MQDYDRHLLIESACDMLRIVCDNGGATEDDYNILADIALLTKQMLDDLPK